MGDISGSREPNPQAVSALSGFDPGREKSAFMAGWLTAVNRRDVAPEEAWLTYLDCKERRREDGEWS